MGFRKNKKKSASAPASAGLPPAPLPPLPGMPLPPLENGSLPPLPILENAPLPDATLPTELPPPPAEEASNNEDSENDYNELWAKKSNKPLPQIYGHIDRISAGEAGSLLDRYADRFGHALDRDIIVLRKQQHDDKLSQIRDAPVVELLDDEVVELSNQEKLVAIEDEIRSLKPLYQEAKSSGDEEQLAELKPQLENLLAERKELKNQLDEEPIAKEKPVARAKTTVANESTEEDIFVEFVRIVDELLGSNLPSDIVDSFVASEDFAIYQSVGSDPNSADDEMRSLFFAIVDGQLGNMEQSSIDKFVKSPDFQTYGKVGEIYQ